MKLLAFYIVYFLAVFVVPTWRLWQRTDVNGLMLKFDDTAEGYVGRWFRMVLVGVFVLLIALAFKLSPDLLCPLPWLSYPAARFAGWTLLLASAALVVVAQINMGASWRIGIDDQEQPPLVTTGLFARSRNPIFLGMRLNLLGLLIVLPNAFTLAILLVAEVLIQVQVRLEEAHLRAAIGEAYDDFRSRVPRWL